MAVDPELNPDAWDYAILSGIPTPGICKISNGAKVLNWDERKGYGTSGAASVFTGDKLARFVMRIEFYDGVRGLSSSDARLVWEQELLPVLEAASDGKTAIDFYHPSVSEKPVDVRAAVPEEIGQLTQEGDLWTVEVKFLQFRKPQPKIGKPTGSTASKGAETAKDQTDREIDDALADFNAARGGFRPGLGSSADNILSGVA